MLHMEDEASVWWFKPLVHSRVSSFAEFSQGLIKTFDEERTKEVGSHHHGRGIAPTLLQLWRSSLQNIWRRQPLHWKEEPLQPHRHPKTHQGMSEVPLFISANHLKNCGNSYVEVQGSKHMDTLEPYDCIALCKGFKEEMNPHPHTSLLSCI